MRKLKKIIRFLDWCEDKLLFLFCIVIFLIGLYGLIDSYLVYQHANDYSLLAYKPGYEGEKPERKIKGNMVAWLTVDDTNIDYPVMQGKTNEEYLNKDPYGDYSLSGSIFLDSRNAPDFTDDYSLIYGHHMDGNYMFGSLHSYLEEDFFEKHRTGTLTVENKVYGIRFFAAMNQEATQNVIFNPTEHTKEEIIRYIQEEAEIFDETMAQDLQEDVKLLALSTCKYPDSVERVVVVGILNLQK